MYNTILKTETKGFPQIVSQMLQNHDNKTILSPFSIKIGISELFLVRDPFTKWFLQAQN